MESQPVASVFCPAIGLGHCGPTRFNSQRSAERSVSRTSIPDLFEKCQDDEQLTMLTAYDTPVARQVDRTVEDGNFPAEENVFDPIED